MDQDPVRVLIVDDHRLFADALRMLLERQPGIEVVGIAGDGAEAIDLAVLEHADVVLMDLTLPVVDGLEATRRLHAIHGAAKVIAMTGRSEDEVRIAAFDAGAAGFLVKDHVHERVVGEIFAAAGR